MGEDHLHIRLGKHFTGSDLLALTKCLFELESVVERSPHRIMNLLKTETVTLNFSDLLTFARIRRETRLKNHVRFALVVNTPEKYGVMRMLQAVDTHPLTEIGIFLDFTSALKWIRGEPGIFCRGFPPGTQSRE